MESLENRVNNSKKIKNEGLLAKTGRNKWFRRSMLPLSFPLILGLNGCDGERDFKYPTKHSVQEFIDKNKKQNQPPDTELISEISGGGSGMSFSFKGVDEDGSISGYEVYLDGPKSQDWIDHNLVKDSILVDLPDGDYTFKVRSIDDENEMDPTPAEYRFNLEEGVYREGHRSMEKSRVSFPTTSPLRSSTFEVMSSNAQVETRADGSFDLSLDYIVDSEVIVLTEDNKPVLLGYAIEGDKGIELSAESTVIALAMMNPIFINAPIEVKREISQLIKADPPFRSLINKLDHLLEGGSTIFNLSSDGGFYISINENLERLLQGRAGKLAAGEDPPYLEDLAGSDVRFVNPRNIFYAAFINSLPDSTKKDIILLSPKKGFIDFNLYPPSFFAEPTERVYPLGDGGFGIHLHKGFSGNLEENFDGVNYPAGMATAANVFEGISNVLSIIAGGYDLYDELAPLEITFRSMDVKTLEGVREFIVDVQDKKYIEAFSDAVNLVDYNKEMIAERIAAMGSKKSALIVAEHLATLVPVLGQIVAAIKVGSALDQLPFFYDLAFAPSSMDYKVTQTNGVLGEYSPSTNRAPDIPLLLSPLMWATSVPLEVKLDWSKTKDPDGDDVTYKVYFEKNDDTPDEVLKSGLSVSEFLVKDLEYGTNYYWYVVASDGKLTSTSSTYKFTTITLPENHSPNKPFNPSPTNLAIDVPLEVLLDWSGSDPDGDKLTYAVYFEKNDSTPDQVLKAGLTESEVTVSNLENNVEYYWQVIASDGKLTTSGNVWSFTTKPRSTEGSGIIVFVSEIGDLYYELFRMRLDGSSITQITQNLKDPINGLSDKYSPSISPNGSKVAFSLGSSVEDEIYIINMDGTGLIRLTNNSAIDRYPSWSPDGSKIAFTSKRDGNYEIYVMRSDGTSQTRLTDNPGIDAFPSWSSDGTKIIYESNHDIWVMNSNGSDKKYLTEGSYPTGSSR